MISAHEQFNQKEGRAYCKLHLLHMEASCTDSSSCAQQIKEGEIVLLRKNDVYKPVTLAKGRRVVFERMSFLPDSAIGKPYGSQFQVKGHILVSSQRTDTAAQYVTGAVTIEQNKDNRRIMDDGSSQTLTSEDIHHMKEEGRSGQEILESVIQGSSSFKEKTTFSQEKYVKKKEKKHVSVISIIKPSTRLLCKMYYSKSPSKICHLRLDTIGRMLTFSNVHAGVNALVVETCQGLLIGSVLERLGGMGNLVQVFFGDNPVHTALDNFGHLSTKDKSIVMTFPFKRVSSLLQPKETSNTEELHISPVEDKMVIDIEQLKTNENDCMELEVVTDKCSKVGGDTSPPLKKYKQSEASLEVVDPDNNNTLNTDNNNGVETSENQDYEKLVVEENIQATKNSPNEDQKIKEERRRLKEEGYKHAASFLSSTPMDCLLIATRFHPEPILTALLPFVAPSRPIVVYSQFQEPLVSCYRKLRNEGGMFNLQLSETWLRNYQVLPGRTHPAVTMDAQSGYLLTGTTILTTDK